MLSWLHIVTIREAWTVCGKMSSDLAMQMYVQEFQQVLNMCRSCDSHVIIM